MTRPLLNRNDMEDIARRLNVKPSEVLQWDEWARARGLTWNEFMRSCIRYTVNAPTPEHHEVQEALNILEELQSQTDSGVAQLGLQQATKRLRYVLSGEQ